MRLYDYAWNTITSISKRDYDCLRLLLDEDLDYPVLTSEPEGHVIKIPVPRPLGEGYFELQGLRFSGSPESWVVLWRLFKASLYHAALHVAESNFKMYAPWAKGKDPKNAVYAVSLVEDLKVTVRAAKLWPGLIGDLAYANCVAALRCFDPDAISDRALRAAVKLLLAVWGVTTLTDSKDDRVMVDLVELVKQTVFDSAEVRNELGSTYLKHAFEKVYGYISAHGTLSEVPSFPHTESHGISSVFRGNIRGRKITRDTLYSAYKALGAIPEVASEERALYESKELTQGYLEFRQKAEAIRSKYAEFCADTHLRGVEYPRGDYAAFLRMRSQLSGPIKTIRDQLLLVKNVPDETAGHESGQLDIQAAIQAVASKSKRNDVFVRDEPVHKAEAWAILVDASKSIAPRGLEAKGLVTCLAEVTRTLIPQKNLWGVFAFSDTFQIVKDFDEEYSIDARARIAGVEQRSGTMLPDALQVVARSLREKPVDIRIIVVASDGHPTGYPGIEEQMVSTVKEINKAGILLLGVGVDEQAILDYFRVNCTAETPYQLMKTFVRSYLELSSMF
ncbi:MAG: VWA domain-containing protein [Thermoprotei archaeon]